MAASDAPPAPDGPGDPSGPAEPGDPAGPAEPGGAAEPGEAELLVTPRAKVLDELRVSEEEFEWAFGRTLDLLEDGPDDEDDPAVEDLEIVLNGRTFRLGEVATVEIAGDLTELGPLPDPPEAAAAELDRDGEPDRPAG